MRPTLCFAFLFLLRFAQAQDAPPTKFIVGVTLNYVSSHTKAIDGDPNFPIHYNSNLASINPYFAYRLGSHWALGFQGSLEYLNFSYYIRSQSEDLYTSTSTYSVGLFDRYYVGTDNALQFFLESGAVYSRSESNSEDQFFIFSPYKSSKEFTAYLSPGITWSVSKRINLIGRFGKLNYTKGNGTPRQALESSTNYDYLNLQLNGKTLFLGAELKI